MGVRFEVDVESCAASFGAGSFQSEDLSVLHARVCVGSGANDVAVRVGDHRADVGIRRGQADALLCEFECSVQKRFVQRSERTCKEKSITDDYSTLVILSGVICREGSVHLA